MLKITFVWNILNIEFSVVVKKIDCLVPSVNNYEDTFIKYTIKKQDVLGYSDESLLRHFTIKSENEDEYIFYGGTAKVESIF